MIHYSAEEPFTKYEICLVFARILDLPHAHIIPDAGPPPPGTANYFTPFITIYDLMRVYLFPVFGNRVYTTPTQYAVIPA